MKYPKAGDLQRETASHLATNPAKQNPYEVRSDSGLEGVFADEDEANFYAEEIRGSGARGVTVDRQERGTRPRAPRYALQNPASEWAAADRTVSNMAQNIDAIGIDGCDMLLKYVGVDVDDAGHGWLVRCEDANTVTVELADGTIARYPADHVWPLGGRYPEHRSRARRNPASDRLFAGVYPTGIVYADKARERDGDYLRVAFLPFSTLMLQWSPGNHPAELREEIMQDAAKIIARRGEPFEVSSSGQTVTLGGGPRQRPPGAPPQYHTPTGRPPGVPNPGRRVLREKWGDASEIVIESNRYGYTGWLESKRGGGRLPISFGATQPSNALEAMEIAKRFLRAAHGRSNPAGLTAKGERMYEHIKEGYGDDPRAAEIAARTVLARATGTTGLKKRRR